MKGEGMDETLISRAITENYLRDFLDSLVADVAVVGAGPSGLTAAYCLAREGIKTVVFERQLRIGGGMPGGAMMMSRIVVQEEGKEILDEFDVSSVKYQGEYFVADSLETISTMCSKTIKAGARVFNLIDVEDVVIRENRIAGLVLNWSAVAWSKLHVDPLATRCKVVIDATGHDAEVCRLVARKLGPVLRTKTGEVIGEKPMWAERGEGEILENTREVYPGLLVAGMAANAVFGSPRMGAIFGGMLLSGRKAAELARELVTAEVREKH
ncbi:MAG: ribose 1,5-bisphosphate isomerase [Chloroflexi bacterium]|nr:MAG: ribose 1,5-bisphosphate isomerase [Chloroflexota bacterium]